jgi:threonine aldolase
MVASAERIGHARAIRKRMGGGMRQAGVLAAAGDYALTHHLARLADDHVRARRLAAALAPFGIVDAARVRTNLVPLDLTKSTVDAPGLAAAARERGVLVSVLAPGIGRLVTHLDVDDAGIDRAIEVLTGILRG